MQINYKTIGEFDKEFRLIEGIYTIEQLDGRKWIWTTQEFSGIVTNIDSVTFGVMSEIENILCYDNIKMEIKRECLNVFRIPTVGRNIFSVKLEHAFYANNDDRELGVKIMGINVDGDIVL